MTTRSPAPNHRSPLLIITLFALPLLSPFFRLISACTHDGHLHYHRIAAMLHAWQNGLFFSRWLPDLAFGYGYPFFLYREGAPLFLTLIPHALGLPLPAAVNLFYMACILAAGWFMYLWVNDTFGPLSGIVAAVAYMAAPYQLIDAIIRGNQPESLALPLFPAFALVWDGALCGEASAVPFLISVFGLLFLALSHNISLLLFTPILFIYLTLVAWLNQLELKTAVIRLTLIFALGLGLTAFYVGPALLELDEITISQSVTTPQQRFPLQFCHPQRDFCSGRTGRSRSLKSAVVNPPRLGSLLVGGCGRWTIFPWSATKKTMT